MERLAKEAELAATQRNMKELYIITRITSSQLSGTYPHSNKPITDKNSQRISTQEAQLDRWVEHFEAALNRPAPAEQPLAGMSTFTIPVPPGN